MPWYKGIYITVADAANSKISDVGICRKWSAVNKAKINEWNGYVRDADNQALATRYGTTVANIKKMRKSMFKKEGVIGGGPMTYKLNAKLKGCSCNWTGAVSR